jgi:hypothetical protein
MRRGREGFGGRIISSIPNTTLGEMMQILNIP